MRDSVDAIYYRDAASLPTVRSVSALARLSLYRDFMREMRPNQNTRVLDIGGSDEEGIDSNMLEKQYPWPERIVCAGLGDGQEFIKKYPQIEYKKIYPNSELPFSKKEFDIVYSNAVLEHVGLDLQRKQFADEARRVGRSIFFTVPNRWFPVEHHTGIPLLHWNSHLFRFLTAKTRLQFWADPVNLDFLSRRSLCREFGDAKVTYAGIRLGPLSSNLIMIIKPVGQ